MLRRMAKLVLSIKKAVDKPERERTHHGGNGGHGGQGGGHRPRQGRNNQDQRKPQENFEQKMARFLKDSEDRLTSLKRNTESKRGGRGARRG